MADDVIEVSLAELRSRGVVRVSRPPAEALLVVVGGEIRAYNGICPHLGGPLLEGEIRGDRIVCPWHRYEWSLASGKCFTVPGQIWEGVEGYERPTAPFSRNLTPLRFELTADSVRLKLPRSNRAAARATLEPGDPRR